jgi:hypothetical protein
MAGSEPRAEAELLLGTFQTSGNVRCLSAFRAFALCQLSDSVDSAEG